MIVEASTGTTGASPSSKLPDYLWVVSLAPPLLFMALYAWGERGRRLWLDEFFTLTLMKASGLDHLWQGIIAGIDANPPLFIVSSWLITNFVFPDVAPELVLRAFGIAIVVSLQFVALNVMRRFISMPASVLAVMLMLVGPNMYSLALELRHYALFVFVTALSLWTMLNAVSSRQKWAGVVFAGALGVLALSHNFGIIYALSMAVSVFAIGLVERDRKLLQRSAVACVIAIATFLVWLPALLSQAALADPYGWIQPPTRSELMSAFHLSKVALLSVATLPILWMIAGVFRRPAFIIGEMDDRRREAFVLATCAVLVAGATVVVWLASKYLYPVFVDRYFSPNVLYSYGAVAAACALFLRVPFLKVLPAWFLAIVMTVIVGAYYVGKREAYIHSHFCMTDDGRNFAETPMVEPNIPIVAMSPQVWFPRRHYVGPQYILALDWDVVKKYPTKSVNNAVDYNIMSRIREWGNVAGIKDTREILAEYPEFLVLEQDRYSWLTNLRAQHTLNGVLLGSAGECKLWKISVVR